MPIYADNHDIEFRRFMTVFCRFIATRTRSLCSERWKSSTSAYNVAWWRYRYGIEKLTIYRSRVRVLPRAVERGCKKLGFLGFLTYNVFGGTLSLVFSRMNEEQRMTNLDGSHIGHGAMCLHRLQLLQAPFQFFQRFQRKSTLLVFYIQLTHKVTSRRSRTLTIIAVVLHSENAFVHTEP